MSKQDEQEAANDVFDWMMRCDESLDEVIVSLRNAGVKVEDEQRGIVARWLDMFDDATRIPLRCRVAMLRGWLSVDGRR